MIRKVVGPGRLSVGRCSRSGVRNQRVAPVPVGRLRYTGGVSHLLGYAQVSTAEQNADLQTDELTAAGCWRVWTDHAYGVLDRRPQFDELLGQLRPGDTLVVWRLDRLGRSLRHLIDVVTALDDRGVGFRSLRESIDTTAPGGRLVFHLFGALAQFSVIWTRRDDGRAGGGPGARPVRRPALQARCGAAADRPHALRRACAHRRPDRPGSRRQPHLHLQSLGTGHGRSERGRGAANGVHGVSAGERLVTVLVTVAVPEAAAPEDAAALVADAAVSSALD